MDRITEDIRLMCYRILDALILMDNIERLPNCNNCKKKLNCEHGVKWGEMVRVNCFEWEKPDEEK